MIVDLILQVEFSQLNNDGSKIILPRHKIYNKKQPSDKMVLILEGRMVVTIGQTEMNFEAGSWHFFGLEILDKIIQMIESGKNENTGSSSTQSPITSTAPVHEPSVTSRTRGSSTQRSSFRGSQGAIVSILSSELLSFLIRTSTSNFFLCFFFAKFNISEF